MYTCNTVCLKYSEIKGFTCIIGCITGVLQVYYTCFKTS